MNEHEKRLRDTLAAMKGASIETLEYLSHLTDAALAQARADALDEARDILGGAFRDCEAVHSGPLYLSGVRDLHSAAQSRLAALAGTTPPASIPLEKARHELVRLKSRFTDDTPAQIAARGAIATVALRLGVPLDGETCTAAQVDQSTQCRAVYDEPDHSPTPGTCPGCDKPADGSEGHRFSCSVDGKRQVALGASLTRRHEFNACVSCGRDVKRGRCVGCGVVGSECVCPVVVP